MLQINMAVAIDNANAKQYSHLIQAVLQKFFFLGCSVREGSRRGGGEEDGRDSRGRVGRDSRGRVGRDSRGRVGREFEKESWEGI